MKDKLIVALDVDNLKKAKALVDKLCPYVKIFKVGSELFTSCGPEAIHMIHKRKAKVFLDLKFYDIPNTVAKSVKAAKNLGVYMMNVHASGGKEMMKSAFSARGKNRHPILLAVTVLTSLDTKALKAIGVKRSPITHVRNLALLTKTAGLDGIVCSPREIVSIRKTCGKNFTIVTPGIRPKSAKVQDQKRISTPQYALSHGADYIVVGRPITQSKNPVLVARSILDNI